MVDLEALQTDEDLALVKDLIARHVRYTHSGYAERLLKDWTRTKARFVKVMPRDYKRVLLAEARARSEDREPAFDELVGVARG
jgi:glutamate synthase (NADPH) large chain